MTPGDHLQTVYALWLPGHQLARAAAPWLDRTASSRARAAGELRRLALRGVFGPLQALFGTVSGWNVFVLLTYVGAGARRALATRARARPRRRARRRARVRARALPGRAVDRPPARISMLLPLALYGLERRRTLLAAAALASIPLSGQVHLALGSDPVRARVRARTAAAAARAISAAAGVAAGILVWAVSLRDTVERPYTEVERYSATLGDFLARDPGEFERFVYLGWLLPLAAAAGVGCLCFRNTISSGRRLALVLGLGALVPACSRSAPTCPATACSGGIRRCKPPACPSGCRSRASASRPWRRLRSLVFQKHKRALGSSQRSRASSSPSTSGCRSTTRAVADEDNALYAEVAASPPGRLLELPALRRTRTRARLRLLRDPGAAGAARSATRPRRRRRHSAPHASCRSAHATSASALSSSTGRRPASLRSGER